jgi:lipopolysaccharide/colanic/teichoic acid biosynthesis glycosyltransferase
MRRLVDVVVAGVGVVALAPVMALVTALIRVQLGSPVLFRQRRSGRHGQEFTILKFRTMLPPRHEDESDLDRDTALGRRLRALSLDELPQLVNVLRGDMSLIGPRPTLPEQVEHYDERQRGRLAIRPGITGWAQVNGRNSISWPERIELDLWYIDNRTPLLDLKVLWRTVRNVVRPEGITGAGGINQGFPLAGGGSTPSHAAASALAGERRGEP